MKPVYRVRVWRDGGWWLGRVIEASDGADPMPLNCLTQARALAGIDSMVRDLIATVLDASEDAFDIDIEYELPPDVRDSLREAKNARTWLEAAQGLWLEKSALAARVLADKGYSLRETARLLGISHQRVGQLLADDVDPERASVWMVEFEQAIHSERHSHWSVDLPHGFRVLLVLRNQAIQELSSEEFEKEASNWLDEMLRRYRNDLDTRSKSKHQVDA